MKKARFIIALFFVFAHAIVFAQETNIEKALEKGLAAVALMDEGKFDESIVLLEEAQKLDPENISYPYELAYAYYSQKNYKKAVKYLEPLINHKNATDRYFQLLGNSYDILGDKSKAIKTYNVGLKLFPNSGNLHLELGIMELGTKNLNKALTFFEKGIAVEPAFPSNYYWASKIYCSSSDEVYGMIYGEIFMNLERNSRRTAEISQMLYEIYQSEIQFTSDTTVLVSFAQSVTMVNNQLPFGIAVYEPLLMVSLLGQNKINLASLDIIRTNFLNIYVSQNYQKDYPNELFAYQNKVNDAGHFEAYNYWVLMKGDEGACGEWIEANQEKWNGFIAWFKDNKLVIEGSTK